MRKMLFVVLPLSVAWPGKRVSASTQAGVFCVLEFRVAFWRRSSQALSGKGCAFISAGEGRASLKASCAPARQTAAKKIAKRARTNIGLARLFVPNLLCKFQFSMRPELKAVCHFKYRRQNTEDDQTNQNGNDHDDDRRNQLRDYANAPVQFTLIDVGDGLHCFGEMSGLFSY